jgi:uncharacterized repeat protein (TIGR03803 family)
MPTKTIHSILFLAVALTTCNGQTATLATLYSFQGFPTDGKSPGGSLLLLPNGTLCGSTGIGGGSDCGDGAGCGTVYELKPPSVPGGLWTESVIHSFVGYPDAAGPGGDLLLSNGALYGTSGGGANDFGAVFQLTPPETAGAPWAESLLWSASLPDTYGPGGPMVLGPGGTLHSTTSGVKTHKGLHGYQITGAAIFVLIPPATPGGSWTEKTRYDFVGDPATGTNPRSGLTAADGALFGTFYLGGNSSCGTNGCGAVFEVQPPTTASAGSEATIYQFNGPPVDGAFPTAALTAGPGGVLYGITLYGGSGTVCITDTVTRGCGTVFQLTPPTAPGGTWTETVLYSFTGIKGDGALPGANVILGQDGSLYGTTQYGGSATTGSPCTSNGASGCGTAFQLAPPAAPGGTWTETVLYSFTGESDGAIPQGPLLLSPSGVLYGTTSGGGTAGAGTVFSLTLN